MNHFPVAEEFKTKWYKSVSADEKNPQMESEIPEFDFSTKHVNYLAQVSERDRLKKYKRRNANQKLYLNAFADATYVFRGLPDMKSLQRDISLDQETIYFFDFLTQKESLTKNDQTEKRKLEINRMSEQLIRNKQLANDTMLKMGLSMNPSNIPQEKTQEKKEDDMKVNIFDEDATILEGSDRRNSIHSKVSSMEETNDQHNARRQSSVIGNKIFEASRRSFIPRRSSSASMSIESELLKTPIKSPHVHDILEEEEDYIPTRKNSFFNMKSSMNESQDNIPPVSRRASMRVYSRRASAMSAMEGFSPILHQDNDVFVKEEEEEMEQEEDDEQVEEEEDEEDYLKEDTEEEHEETGLYNDEDENEVTLRADKTNPDKTLDEVRVSPLSIKSSSVEC